ncbi:MAG: Rrf2 family transcriptional regulator [Gemmatimonadaceae bacterium]|jgi:Rrf2 family iron-sulfur cluster assembly transcriptional regulator|nr:Rrf2 family transcriptional regulator [Gemmatimonadaceae bacterium]MCC6430500.1 Rrf2 family transcriptional regulator [Gemmatimonadaceae bacterium]
MLNQTAEYALRTAVYLTEHRDRGPLKASELATELSISQNYLSKVLHQLARDGLLISLRGKAGGFRLGRAPEQITLADVVRGFDSVGEGRRCLLGKVACTDLAPCPAHEHWRDLAAGHAKFFHETTLAMLVMHPRQHATAPPTDGIG